MFGKYKTLENRVKELKNITDKERVNVVVNKEEKEEYETGLYNGLELALAIMEGREPVFMTPDQKQNKEQEERKGRTLYGNMKRVVYRKKEE